MIKAEFVEELASKLDQLIPEDVKTMRQDLHKNIKAILTAGLQKADLVTREEFEVQKAVLAKTRARLETLEKKLQQLS